MWRWEANCRRALFLLVSAALSSRTSIITKGLVRTANTLTFPPAHGQHRSAPRLGRLAKPTTRSGRYAVMKLCGQATCRCGIRPTARHGGRRTVRLGMHEGLPALQRGSGKWAILCLALRLLRRRPQREARVILALCRCRARLWEAEQMPLATSTLLLRSWNPQLMPL